MSGRDQIDDLRALVGLVTAHEQWRGGCLNLVASENIHSPLLGRLLASDLSGRYGDYSGRDLRRRRYQGTRYITEIEELADRLARSIPSKLTATCASLLPATSISTTARSRNVLGMLAPTCSRLPPISIS